MQAVGLTAIRRQSRRFNFHNGLDDASGIEVVEHVPSALKDVEGTRRQLLVQPERLAFEIDDLISVAGQNGERTGEFAITSR